jgi:hypothetical protein
MQLRRIQWTPSLLAVACLFSLSGPAAFGAWCDHYKPGPKNSKYHCTLTETRDQKTVCVSEQSKCIFNGATTALHNTICGDVRADVAFVDAGAFSETFGYIDVDRPSGGWDRVASDGSDRLLTALSLKWEREAGHLYQMECKRVE